MNAHIHRDLAIALDNAARDNAWSHTAALHQLGSGEAKDAAKQTMDHTASLIGRLLLL